METRTIHLDSLFKDGLYDIPNYQRSYSWQESQLRDLLEDLIYLPDGTTHFFGNIILDKQDDQYRTDRARRFDQFNVVDGQQRLISAIIFLHVASKLDETVADTIGEDNLLFPVDERPRLLPQDQDKEYFRDSLLGPANLKAKTPSQDLLREAYEFFEEELTDLEDGPSIATLAERIRYDCRVNVVEIDDNSEAASIFESINDRGRPLSTLDKTKSFLMYMDDRTSNQGALEEKIKQRFGGIFRELFVLSTGHGRVEDFNEDSLLRFHWGLYDGYDSNEYFRSFETLKNRLRDRYRSGEAEEVQNEIDDYVQSLREAATAFAAIFEPEHRPEKVQEPLKRLLELGRMANVLPVLMASYLKYGDYDPEGFTQIVEAIETLVFRMYAIDGRRSNTGRGRLVRLAHDIHQDKIMEVEDIVASLDAITDRYTSDERFASQLTVPKFFNNTSSRDIKYLLYRYGQQIDMEVGEEVLKDVSHILSQEFQVEHILAQKLPEEHIPEDLAADFDKHVHRLGNLTIASRYWNSSYGNLPFSEKQRATGKREKDYESSAIRVQRELAEFDEFSKSEINEREETLVEFALEEWDIHPPEFEDSTSEPPENFKGYFPSNFFDRLSKRQEAMIRVLYDADEPLLSEELIDRIEDEYDISILGSSGLAGVLQGLTQKYSKEFRRSIMPGRWAGSQYEWELTLDEKQEKRLRQELSIE